MSDIITHSTKDVCVNYNKYTHLYGKPSVIKLVKVKQYRLNGLSVIYLKKISNLLKQFYNAC